jgi:hypothetical protein
MDVTPLEQLSRADFAALIKTKFRVWIDAQDSVEMELAEVTAPRMITAGGAKSATYESFALDFLGPAGRLLAQRSYCFESAVIGRFDLFIVPVGRDASGVQYQAAFNRLVKPA